MNRVYKLIIEVFLIFISVHSFGQSNPPSGTIKVNKPKAIQEPHFTGWQKWIKEHIEYPSDALRNNISGVVKVIASIDEKGKVKDVHIKSGIPALNHEAIRVVKSMPPWQPAKVNGKPVKGTVEIPVRFDIKTELPLYKTPDSVDKQFNVNIPFPVGNQTSTFTFIRETPQASFPNYDQWISKHIIYPPQALKNHIEGTINVAAKIDSTGKVIAVLPNVEYKYLTEEAVRVVMSMPKWIPARDENGKPVESIVSLSVKFKLPNK